MEYVRVRRFPCRRLTSRVPVDNVDCLTDSRVQPSKTTRRRTGTLHVQQYLTYNTRNSCHIHCKTNFQFLCIIMQEPYIPVAQAVAFPAPVFGLSAPPPPASNIDSEAMRRFLTSRGFSSGLIKAFEKSMTMFPLRFIIVDDSGSMAAGDGHRLIGTGNSTR